MVGVVTVRSDPDDWFDSRTTTGRAEELGDFQSLFDNSGLCVVVLDRTLRVCHVNANFQREFGWRAATLRGRQVLQVAHRSAHARLRRQFGRLATGALAGISEPVLAVRSDNDQVPAVLTATTVHIHRDRADRAVLVLLHPAPDGEPGPGEGETWPGQQVLSSLEARILECIAAGMSSAQIAVTLYFSRPGVEYHIKAMLRKLDVPNRTALVSRAHFLGLLGAGTWPPKVGPEHIKPPDE